MRINATRIMVKSAQTESAWYADRIGSCFWAEYVSSIWPWKIIQEGSNLHAPLYVHGEDAVAIEERTVDVELVQTVTVVDEVAE